MCALNWRHHPEKDKEERKRRGSRGWKEGWGWGWGLGGRHGYSCEERDVAHVCVCVSLMEVFSFWFGTCDALKVSTCVEGFRGAAVTKSAVHVNIWKVLLILLLFLD